MAANYRYKNTWMYTIGRDAMAIFKSWNHHISWFFVEEMRLDERYKLKDYLSTPATGWVHSFYLRRKEKERGELSIYIDSLLWVLWDHRLHTAIISIYRLFEYVDTIGPCTRARKNASKTSRGKKPVPTQVGKIKIQSCFPFVIANRITTFSALRSCNQETKNTEAWTTHIVCQVIRFILLCF